MKEKIIEILNEIHPEINFSDCLKKFVSDGILDSFDIVQIISSIDEKFGISVSGLDLIAENFESIDAIESLIKSYKKA